MYFKFMKSFFFWVDTPNWSQKLLHEVLKKSTTTILFVEVFTWRLIKKSPRMSQEVWSFTEKIEGKEWKSHSLCIIDRIMRNYARIYHAQRESWNLMIALKSITERKHDKLLFIPISWEKPHRVVNLIYLG